MQQERQALELAAVQPEHLGEEADGALRGRQVPDEILAIEVLKVPLAGGPDVRAGDHPAGGDLLGVGRDRVATT